LKQYLNKVQSKIKI